MNYNYYFEVAAILLCSIIIYDMRRKGQFYRKDARLFFSVVVCQAAFSLVDLISCILLEHTSTVPRGLNEFVLFLYFSLQATTLFLMDNFIFSYANRKIKVASGSFIMSVAFFVTNMIIVLLTPFFRLYCYLDEAGVYHQGSWASLGYYFYFFNMLLILAFIGTHSNKFLSIEKNSIAVSVVIISGATFLQFNSRASLIVGMSSSIAMLLWYISLENPNSYLDKVTDSGNGEALRRRMEAWDANMRTHSVIFLNLQNMQQVEANIGHENTEKLYRLICDFLKKTVVKPKDVYRIDETTFAIVSHGDVSVNQELANIIRSKFIKPWKIDNEMSVTVHVQVFVCEYPKHFFDYPSMLELQSYVGSILSTNRSMELLVMGDEILEKWQRYQDVEIALRKALSEKTIEVYYQPVYDSENHRIISLEALSRINDSKLGFIPPEEFVSIAETTGLIIPMGQLVLEKVCKFMSEQLVDDLSEVGMEVNLSPIQMKEKTAMEKLEATISSYNIAPERINFEVTESATAESPEQLKETMDFMRGFGSRFMLDDYGTGYSNITYLANFDFDYIKFDKSLVWSYFENEISRTILDKEFEIILKLGKQIVLEGIENRNQFEALNQYRIKYFQGYYFSRALPENEIIEYLKNPSPIDMF